MKRYSWIYWGCCGVAMMLGTQLCAAVPENRELAMSKCTNEAAPAVESESDSMMEEEEEGNCGRCGGCMQENHCGKGSCTMGQGCSKESSDNTTTPAVQSRQSAAQKVKQGY